MHRIMIVEDDDVISDAIAKTLRQWNHDVYQVQDFKDVMGSFLEFQPHLVLMDLTLPYYNGYHWCTEIRRVSQVPIIFISSASENMNIVMAMNMGADDYMVKPFDLSVLEAKVHAMLRRTYDFGGELDILESKGLILSLSEMKVKYQSKEVILTKNEFRILEALLKKKGVITREELMEKLWQSDLYIDDNTLTVNVARLRKTLGDLGCGDFIHTKKGVGYYIE